MAGKIRMIITWVKTKPLLAAVPLVFAISLAGLPAHAPKAAKPISKPLPKVTKSAPSEPALTSANDPFVVKRILNIEGPFIHGTYVWDDEGVPPGPLVVTIDLKAQTLSVFRGGYEIGAAVILYGADDKPTPIGSFPILEKDADHVSNLYDAPMPYMLRLTNDGVAIHGSDVEWGWATHGCIGVPSEFAALLFAQAKVGDRVIITDGKMMTVEQPAT
ncbi:L,D-transpeptidase family protein [Rhizorhapis suberifaciens]|uniref:Lipoprotein-anchoring transpeptidase ErfK/SrfK n=1 Tax=Rhizorhapis suberifaciens TaxID=13656 RepID=A0A840HVZ9_9SPHN|nr:L,D-transpeptidase family protein [Rhizorhapis suberifaciens]MBB4641797.1 lipoprotein-anchoring transpeptidase ErfK/SrfK [Rhizorhapis suberifaciens]